MKKLTAMLLALCLLLSACPVFATEIPAASAVALDAEGTVKAYIGTPLTLGVTVEPSGADESTLKWTSSEKKYATVSGGVVTPLKEGTTTITVKTPDGESKDSVKVKVINPKKPTSVALEGEESVSLEMGDTLTLNAVVSPDTAERNLSWKSSSKKIAKVDANGVVTPVSTGTATITVTATYGKTTKTDSVKVKVTDMYKPTGITLEETGTVRVALGDTLTLHAAVQPAEAKSLPQWSSSDKKIAAVDGNGVVTAKKEGTVTITAKTYNGKKDTVKVKVFDPKKPSEVVLNQSGSVLLSIEDTVDLNATVYPDTAEYTLKWSSSDKKIAAVDENGVVTPKKVGDVTITATATRGKTSKKDTVKVRVYHPLKALYVELDQSGTVKLDLGKTLDLQAVVFPDTAEYTLSWSTSDKKIATVDANGIVTPKKEGTATITVKTSNGKKDTVKVKVVDPTKATSVALDLEGTQTITLYDDVLQLNATMQPDTATSKITWSSSNKKVATVDANGLVTPVGAGTAKITVKTSTGKTDTVSVKVLDPYKPSKVVLSHDGQQTITLYDDVLQLSAALQPETARSELKWKSSNKKVATVDANGLVTPVGAGIAKITVTTRNSKTDTVTVKVKDPYKPSKVVLEQSGTVQLDIDKTVQLAAGLEPVTARSDLKWKTSNKKVATVDANGVVTPLKEGTAKITVTTRNGKTDTVTIKVVDPYKPTKLKVSWSGSLNMRPGDTLQINTTLEPATAITTLTWKSSNESVATVSADGLITCLKEGTAKITVTTANGISVPMTVKCLSEREIIVQSVKDALGSDLISRMKSAGYSVTFQMADAPSGKLWWQLWFQSKSGTFVYGNDKVNYTLMQDMYDAIVSVDVFGFTSTDLNAFSNVRANLKVGGYNSQTANSSGWDMQLSSSPSETRMVQISMDWSETGRTNWETISIP